jgi:hypothetical protein
MSSIIASFDIDKCERVTHDDPVRLDLRYKFHEDKVWIATFTHGCYTVASFGPPRTIHAPRPERLVRHNVCSRSPRRPRRTACGLTDLRTVD